MTSSRKARMIQTTKVQCGEKNAAEEATLRMAYATRSGPYYRGTGRKRIISPGSSGQREEKHSPLFTALADPWA
jgi:hypothetical protein